MLIHFSISGKTNKLVKPQSQISQNGICVGFSFVCSAIQLIFTENYCLKSNVLDIERENVKWDREGFLFQVT